MKVIRGTRAPAIAALGAMLMLGVGAADAPASGWEDLTGYYVAVAGGVDGCPALFGSTFDPRKLCGTDLGAGWSPVGAEDVHVCPSGRTVADSVLFSRPITVAEDVVPKLTPALATTFVHSLFSRDCADRSRFLTDLRPLSTTLMSGVSAEGQWSFSVPGRGGGVFTVIAIDRDVLSVSVSDDDGMPDSATVLRIVQSAVHRFQNPRPFAGPFAQVIVPASVAPSGSDPEMLGPQPR